MTDIVERLGFDSARCEANFSKGVATNIDEAAAEIVRLRAALAEIIECWKLGGDVFDAVIIAERAIAGNGQVTTSGD